MTTLSTDALHSQIKNQILAFIPLTGTTLMQRIGNGTLDGSRLYKSQAPDTVVYPFGVMRLMNQQTLGDYDSDREQMDLEIMLFGRPRSQGKTLEDLADLIDQALLRYKDSSSGLVFSRSRQRDTMPPPVDPADREVVQIRLVYSLKVWPRYLTQWSDPTPDVPDLPYMVVITDAGGDLAVSDESPDLPQGSVTVDPTTGELIVNL